MNPPKSKRLPFLTLLAASAWLTLCAASLTHGDEPAETDFASECAEVQGPNHYAAACAALRPRWIAMGGVVYMDRATEDPLTLMQSTSSTAEQLNVNDIDYSWELGYDVSLMRMCWDDTALEVRYLDLRDHTGSTLVPVSNSQVQINTSPPVFAPNVQSIDARFTNSLFSFEVNYHYPLYDFLNLFGGFRYVSFDDDITAVLDASPQSFLFKTTTQNDMYGGQLGLVTLPYRPEIGCIWLSGFGKLGIFGNDADHRGRIDTGLSSLAVNDSPDDSSFLGEFGATSRIWLGQHISVSASYSLLWLESVAIASRQVAVSDYFSGVGSTSHGSTVFHGATLSVACYF